MSRLLLELGFEELPAAYLAPAAAQLKDDVKKMLEEKRLAHSEISSTYTVRRFVLTVDGLAEKQADISQEKKGPRYDVAYRDTKLTDIGKKFLDSNRVQEKDMAIKEEKGQKYLYVNIFEKGKETGEVIAAAMPDIIKGLRFPRVMTWDETLVTFARPLRWIVCLLDGKTVGFNYGRTASGNETRLHKFIHNNQKAAVSGADSYFELMSKNGIQLNQEERKKEIMAQTEALLLPSGLKILPDNGLLEMLAASVETVSVMAGAFDEKYLFLPDRVIITAMREHQRYFAVLKNDGSFTNCFVNVRDGGEENMDFVVKQHARVLFSRLNDAEFFYREDLKQPLESFIPKLKEAVFISGLGTMFEKMERMKLLAEASAGLFGYNDPALLSHIARLSKADLNTNMVGEKEYAGLRGFMGGVYLEKQGGDKKTCAAVSEHYYPNMVGDTLPSTTEGLLVSMIDKMDNLCGFFSAGDRFKPTGSKDPYAVRRQAMNIIYIILEKKLDIDLEKFIVVNLDAYKKQFGKCAEKSEITEFLKQREINYFKDKGVDYDIINAVTAPAGLNLLDDWAKAQVLMDARKKDTTDFNDRIFALSRIANIIPQDFKPGAVDVKLFEDAEEKALYEKFSAEQSKLSELIKGKKNGEAFSVISGFKPAVDAYFGKVLVNAREEAKKNNRLSMLSQLKQAFGAFADFSRIVVDRK
ncbi:MAG: glycine--tRNA ligase subunit beta [Spirochaetia bacterium]|nr:glycine--tRNA ligase subunit beta [Spirochaetia bacterium]